MQLVVRTSDHEWDLTVPEWRSASVRQLADAIRHGVDRAAIDGIDIEPDTLLGDTAAHVGSIIDLEPDLHPTTGLVLAVVSGPGSGEVIPLEEGAYVLGAGTEANVVLPDRTAPAAAVVLTVLANVARVRPLAQEVILDGTLLAGEAKLSTDSLLRIGNTVIVVRAHADHMPGRERAQRRGTAAFSRPPRMVPSSRPPGIVVPPAPPAPGRPQRFRWATALAPLAAGAAMAVLFSPFMLIFALLSPIMVTANWFEDRARIRREKRESNERLEEDLHRFETELGAGATMERRRLIRRHPDPPELIDRAIAGTGTLWERRPGHDDFLELLGGYGNRHWKPPIEQSHGSPAPAAVELLAHHADLALAPIAVRLGPGLICGIEGPRPAATEIAIGLLAQAAVLHGPSDLRVVVLTERDRVHDWDWVKWLPHTVCDRSAEQRWLAAGPDERIQVMRLLNELDGDQPVTLLVVDLEGLNEPDQAPIRDLLAGTGPAVTGLVVGELPSSCTTVITAGSTTRLSMPVTAAVVDGLAPVRLSAATAARAARGLARYEDPDLRDSGGDLPPYARLVDLLEFDSISASRVLARWRGQEPGSLAAPIGESGAGPVVIDLVSDGPHGLVAGTTGSGKSELLRTMVAGMAASIDPTGLNFVLIDYKGGSAFDVCSELPHTVGLVTDLDAHLGERALVSLEAELRHREGMLRNAGASDVGEYLAAGHEPPLPRLVVIIDEFAALAKELPAFVASLVDIAQRGRSLGVHLVLATQRPSGVVSENIRANTNLRIALRVQDAADSSDVIDDTRAAAIGRRLPGRAFVRFGPAETFPFQAALITGSSTSSHKPAPVQEFTFGFEQASIERPPTDSAESDLDTLVRAISDAAEAAGISPPRRPWLEQLPARLAPGTIDLAAPADGVGVTIGLLDDPYRQDQVPFAWSAARGNLLLYGAPGAGTSTALRTIATRLAASYDPDDLHLYGIDFDTQGLLELRELPHSGAMVAADDAERQQRLIRFLRTTIEDRRRRVAAGRLPSGDPTILLLIDDYGALRSSLDEAADHRHLDALSRVVTDGPGLGVYTIATATRASAIPNAIASVVAEKLVFNMADATELSSFGLYGSALPAFVPGRAVNLASGHEVQLDLPLPLENIQGSPHSCRPTPIEVLGAEVKLSDIIDSALLADDIWHLPIGIGDVDLEPAGWALAGGEGVLIAGSSRSGRTSTLIAAAATVARHRSDVHMIGIAPRPSAIAGLPTLTLVDAADAGSALEELDPTGEWLVLIDDAEFLTDPSGSLQRLLAARPHRLRVIAAGRADVLRTSYGHWTQEVRRSRNGLLLDPAPLTDGDLFAIQLPRTRPDLPVGRGYLVAGGKVELIQAARP